MDPSYKLFCSQVSGKAPKLLSQNQSNLLKAHSLQEQLFYEHINSLPITQPAHSLNHFLPKFHDVICMQQIPKIEHNSNVQDQKTLQWLQHLKQRYTVRNPDNKFLVLQNLIHSYKKPNVLDIKLGKKGEKILKPKKKDFKDLFILNGCRMYVKHSSTQQQTKDYEIIFLSKYFFKSLKTDQQILNHLGLFFSDSNNIKIQLLNKIIEKLRELILSLKALKGWKFYSSSLCLFYDEENPQKFDVRLIDFGRSEYTGMDEIQEASITGLENVHKFLMGVKEKFREIEENLNHMKIKYLNEQIISIPQRKIQQYEGCSSRQISETYSPKKTLHEIQEEFTTQNNSQQ